MKNRKKILVVGGTGFLGYHLIKDVLKKGWQVTSISTNKPKKIRRLEKVKYLICDISKKNSLSLLKENYNYVINFGGYVDHKNKKKTYQSHYIGCKNLANYFLNKDIENFIQLGSSIEYGFIKSPQNEQSKTKPINVKSTYGKSKLLATNYLIKLYKTKGFPVTILRLYLAYGPYQDINRLIPITIKSCLKDLNFDTSMGRQKRDFVYISDVINLILKTLNNKKSLGQIFNVGSGKATSVKKIIQYIRKKLKKGRPNYGRIKLRRDELLELYPKISKAKNLLKWKPRVNLYNGLNKTINFYKFNSN